MGIEVRFGLGGMMDSSWIVGRRYMVVLDEMGIRRALGVAGWFVG